jgi:predicted permease
MPTYSPVEHLRHLVKHARHAARGLRRAPAFSLIAFIMIALGNGATTAMHTALESVVLRPLPYTDPDRLVSLMHPTTAPGSGERKWGLSLAGYFEFRREAKSFTDLGVYRTSAYAIAGDGAPAEEVRVGVVTHTLLTTLGARPHLGRLFSEDDDRPGAPATVVLGHDFWTRRFGADPNIVGRTIQTSVGSRMVIGVAEQKLRLPMPGPFASTANLAGFGIEVWEPLRPNPNAAPQNNHALSGVARLAPGVTPGRADGELRAIVAKFPERFPTAYSAGFIKSYNFRVSATPLHQEVLGPTVARSLWTLFGAVGFVLVIASANVANLFLVRTEARGREAGIRSALGAGRGHFAAQYFAESLLLTVTAGLAGLAIAFWTLPLLLALAPSDVPLLGATSIGWRTIAFAMAASVGAGLLFGLIPLSRQSVAADACASGRGPTSSAAVGARRTRVGSRARGRAVAAADIVRSVIAEGRLTRRPGADVRGLAAVGSVLTLRPPSSIAAVGAHGAARRPAGGRVLGVAAARLRHRLCGGVPRGASVFKG